MNNPRLCSDQCRWYGTCENTGSKSCYGLSVPEEESWKSRACLTPEGKAMLTPENFFILTPLKS